MSQFIPPQSLPLPPCLASLFLLPEMIAEEGKEGGVRQQAFNEMRYPCFGAIILKQRQLNMTSGTAASSVHFFVTAYRYDLCQMRRPTVSTNTNSYTSYLHNLETWLSTLWHVETSQSRNKHYSICWKQTVTDKYHALQRNSITQSQAFLFGCVPFVCKQEVISALSLMRLNVSSWHSEMYLKCSLQRQLQLSSHDVSFGMT